MNRYILLSILFFSSLISTAQSWKTFKFESGDILFQDLDCGPFCDAIKTVSPAINERRYSHTGLVYVVQDSVYVIEAWDKDVHILPLYKFMERQLTGNGEPKVTLGRVSSDYQFLAGRAVGFALEQRAKPVDDELTYDNGKYYSAELVFDAYKAAHHGKALFEMGTLNFYDPRTARTLPFWDSYFKELNKKVPEGKPGLYPASLALDDNIEIITSFY
jgi:hypothetical protein